MAALEAGFLLVLLVIVSFAPGFFIVRRLAWSPGEKLCGSVGLSLALVYLASWGIDCLWPGTGPIGAVPYAAITLVSVGLAAASWRDIASLFQTRRVRRMAAGFGFLLAWTVLLLAVIRNYAGAGWSGDWLEHFQRSLFFIDRFPVNTPIIGGYILPARPPLMNVVAGFFLAQGPDRFENYQLIFCFLNLLLFLPCCLLLQRMASRRRTHILPLVLLFAASPVVIENVTYTWTKAFAAFYVVLAIYFYLAGWRKRDPIRLLAAFIAISAGMLAHYSAGPYALFLVLHYLIFVFRTRPAKRREIATIGAVCSLFLATWFGWSLAKYGFQGTFASNTSITSNREYQGDYLGKIGDNLYDSIVPVALRDPALFDQFQQPTQAGHIRDAFFISYQTNVLLNMGILGGLLVVWLLVKSLRGPPANRMERNFWLELMPFAVVVGIASAGERDLFGLAHLTLLPMAALGLTLLASAFPWGRIMTVLVIVGCLVDFSLGVFLQVHLESLENTAGRTVFTGVEFTADSGGVGTPGPDSLSSGAWNNWVSKHKMTLARDWSATIKQHVLGNAPLQARWDVISKRLQGWMAEDSLYWHGWYSRHGGSVNFLGDDLGGYSAVCPPIIEGVLLLMMLGLMAVVARESWNAKPERISTSVPLRAAKRTQPSRHAAAAQGARPVQRQKHK